MTLEQVRRILTAEGHSVERSLVSGMYQHSCGGILCSNCTFLIAPETCEIQLGDVTAKQLAHIQENHPELLI